MKIIMKILSIFLIVMIAIFSWYQMGSADRLHHWIDSKGVTHLAKGPPPGGWQINRNHGIFCPRG